MKNKERVYNEILTQFIEEKSNKFTQLGLSKKLEISISTVNNALKPLRKMGAIEVKQRSFRIIDYRKILLYWASIRNLEKEIIYSTYSDLSIKKIENSMPADAEYGCYSGYRFRFDDVPADYSEVYVYCDEKEVEKRFPKRKGPRNIFALKKYGEVSLAQLFVDLWNLKTWYAKEFVMALDKKIRRIAGE